MSMREIIDGASDYSPSLCWCWYSINERERKGEKKGEGEGEGERERVDYESASGPIDHQEFGNVYGQWINHRNDLTVGFSNNTWEKMFDCEASVAPGGCQFKAKQRPYHRGGRENALTGLRLCVVAVVFLIFQRCYKCVLWCSFLCLNICRWDSWRTICPAKVS